MTEQKKNNEQKEQMINDQQFKRASELTKEDLNKLQKVFVKVSKNITKKKRIIFNITFKIPADSKKEKDIYIDFNTFNKFDENKWLLFCIENDLDSSYPEHVIECPIRLFTGKTKDIQSDEVRPYSRYQIFLSESVFINAFFKFHEVKLIEMKAKKIKFIDAGDSLQFDEQLANEF